MKLFIWSGVIVVSSILAGCTGVPKGITPVSGFDVDKYLGTWYEIARLDHSFERGLDRVTAEYSRREDGGIRVVNSGRNKLTGKRQQAEGKAYFVTDPTTGHLKVSFFWIIYGSYVIFELDKPGYDYAFITSYNRSYLWLLSRTPKIEAGLRQRFLDRAKELGFKTESLIFVDQE